MQVVRLEAAWQGEDRDSSPNVIAKGKGFKAQNYLPGTPGRMRQRGPLRDTSLTIWSGSNDQAIAGYLTGNDKVLVGFYDTSSATRFIRPATAPYRLSTAAALASGINAASSEALVDLSANTTTAKTPTGREYIPGPRHTRFGKFDYGIAFDSPNDTDGAGIISNPNGGRERKTALLRWDSSGVGQPVKYAKAPFASQDLRIHYSRLLMLGGTDPVAGTDTIYHNALWYTDLLTDNDFTTGINNADAAEDIWKHDVSLRVNRVNLLGDDADFGVAMAVVGRNMVIFKRRSLMLLTGYDRDTFQLRTIAEGVGCLDPRSIVEVPGGVFFQGQHGYMFFDGVQVEDASRGMHRALLGPALANVGDLGTPGGYVVCSLHAGEYILYTTGFVKSNTSAGNPPLSIEDFSALLHVPTLSWASFNTNAFNAGMMAAGRTEQYPWIADNQTIVRAGVLTTPETATEAQRGHDITTGGGNTNIATKWHSRTVELSSPLAKAKLHRVLVDYEWVVDAGTDEQFTGPVVSLCNSAGTVLDTFNLLSGPDDGREYGRKRTVYDTFIESDDIQVRIEYNSTARALVEAAIHDVWIEFQPAAEKHSGV